MFRKMAGWVAAYGAVTGGLVFVAQTSIAQQNPLVAVRSARANAGEEVTFPVQLVLPITGGSVAGAQNDISFDNTKLSFPQGQTGTGTCSESGAPCVKDSPENEGGCPAGQTCNRNVGPNCVVGPGLPDKQAYFSYIGDPGTATTLRGINVAIAPPNTTTIPTYKRLYTCTVGVLPETPDGSYRLTAVASQPAPGSPGSITSDPTGQALGTDRDDGFIVVGAIACIGDLDANGRVTPAESVKAVLSQVRLEAFINPAADGSGDGRVSPAEVTQVLKNQVSAGTRCDPYQAS